jgi:hypothetical protein
VWFHEPGFKPSGSALGQCRASADAELEKLSEQARQVQTAADKVMPVRSAVALRVGRAVLAHSALGGGPAGLAGMAYQQFDPLRLLRGRPQSP